MNPWKDIPVNIAPYALFVVATAVFGELYLRIEPSDAVAHAIRTAVGLAMIPSAAGFVTKCFWEWPPMRGLTIET